MRFHVGIAAVVCLMSFSLVADERPKKQMSAEEKAMMEAWQKYMTPSEGHKMLNSMIGNWNATVTSWMAPGAPPEKSVGKSTAAWVLGGRYVEQKFEGKAMGMPFTGIGYTGYDNAKKQYVSTWMDSMGTGIMMSTGATSDGGRTWSFTGAFTDPTGKDQQVEQKITVHSRDRHVFEMWGSAPDGTKFRMLEIDYKRRKS